MKEELKNCDKEKFKNCPLEELYTTGRENWDNYTLEGTKVYRCKKCDKEVAYRRIVSI